jgi:integrase
VAAVANTGAQETSAVPQPIERQSSASFAELWWRTRSGHRPSTRARDRTVLDHDILPDFGRQQLHEISQAEVQRWVNELATRLAPSSVRRSSVILMQIFQSAEDAGAIRHNPALRIRLPRVEREEMRFLSPAELDLLLEAVGEQWQTMVLTMVFATLRLGEAAGLRRTDVDPLHRRVRVTNNVVEVAGQLHEGPPKTRAGRRTMTLPAVAMEANEVHLDRFAGIDYLFFMAERFEPRSGSARSGAPRSPERDLPRYDRTI